MKHFFTFLLWYVSLQVYGQFDPLTATPIQCGTELFSTTSVGCYNVVSAGYCGSNYNQYTGPEKLYKFTITTPQNVSIKMAGMTADLDMFLLRSTSPADCIAESSLPLTSGYEYIGAYLEAGTYYLVIDGWSNAVSDYKLALNCAPSTGIPLCNFAENLSCGQTLTGDTKSGINQIQGPYCNQFCNYGGNEKIFKIEVPFKTIVNLSATGLVADLDMFLLSACDRNACIAYSGKSGVNSENISVTLNQGTYYIVLDGYVNSASTYSITYTCQQNTTPLNCNDAIVTNYSGDGSNLRFNYIFTAPQGYTFLRWKYNTTILSTSSNVHLLFNASGNYNICAEYLEVATGQVKSCCKLACITLPTSCENTIQYAYVNGVFKLSLAGVASNYQNINWRNDTDGTALDPNNVPASCRNIWVTVTYFNTSTNCWSLCCRYINFCPPSSCQDNISYQYSSTTNSFQFTFNAPYATNVTWKIDDTNTTLPYGIYSLPQGFQCGDKNISVYYFDTVSRCWRVCCKKVYICPPVSCDQSISMAYSPSQNAFQFSMNLPGNPSLFWKIEETNTYLPNGLFVLPSGWTCQERTVSAYYFDPQIQCYRVCCKKVVICPPQQCTGNIEFVYLPAGQFKFTLNSANAQNVVWKFDATGTIIPNGLFTIPSGWTCQERSVSAYYYDPAISAWRICSKNILLCPPTSCEDNIQYTYNGVTNSFHFTLSGYSNAIWKFDDTGQYIPNGIFTIPAGWGCQDRVISVYYLDPVTQCYRACCKKVSLCPPTSCQNAISHHYSPDGNTLYLNYNGNASQILQWLVEESGQTLGAAQSISYPVGTSCHTKTFSIQYKENGVWKMCCKKINVCNPNSCNSTITLTNNATSVQASIPTNLQNVIWFAPNTNTQIGSGNVLNIPLVNQQINTLVGVQFYNPAIGAYDACYKNVVVSCPLPTAAFNADVAGNQVTLTNTSIGATSYSWYISNGTFTPDCNNGTTHPTVIFTSGTHEICLTATNSCGSNTLCKNVVIHTGYDCSFQIPSDICGRAGDELLIPVRVQKFNDVLTFNFTIRSTNPGSLEFLNIEQYNPVIENGSNHYLAADHVRFFWSNANAKTLPDNTVLFYIRCKFSQTVTSNVDIHFSNDPVKAEAYGGNLQKLNLELINGSACLNTNPLTYSVLGQVMTHTVLRPMANTNVILNAPANTTTMTNSTGNYSFGSVNAGSSVVINPTSNVPHNAGVNALDIVRLQRHLLFIDLLTSPYKIIAADVNNDKVVNALDVVSMQRMQLQLISEFPNNTSHRFVPMSHVFTGDPLVSNFPEEIAIPNLNSDITNADFYGIKIGDLDDSYQPSTNIGNKLTSSDTVSVMLNRVYSLKNSIVKVPVTVRNFKNMAALEGTIHWDTTQLQFVKAGDFALFGLDEDNFATPTQLGKDILTFSWTTGSLAGISKDEDAIIFNLYFNSLLDEGQTASITFMQQPLPMFAANASLELVYVDVVNADVKVIAPVEVLSDVQEPLCSNSNDGSIALNVKGGTGQYQILWSDANLSGYSQTQLSEGQYKYTITDVLASIEVIDSVTIKQPLPLEVTHSITNDNNGGYTIVLDVKGGTAPYTFYQDNLVIAEEFQVTEPGVYSIIIFDANNCSVKHTIEINTVKTEDFNNDQLINIYPVPADDLIFVKSSEIGLIGTAYEIISEDGRLLNQGIIQGQSIDVRHLVDGMYFMRFKTDKAHTIKKFVIIK